MAPRVNTYSMYLREIFCVCLVVTVAMYICNAASRRAMSYFSSGPNRSWTTSLQLWKETSRGRSLSKDALRCLRGTGDGRSPLSHLHFQGKGLNVETFSPLPGTESVFKCTHKHREHTFNIITSELLFKYLASCKNNEKFRNGVSKHRCHDWTREALVAWCGFCS